MFNKLMFIVSIVLYFFISYFLLSFSFNETCLLVFFNFLGLYAFSIYDMRIMKSINELIIRVLIGSGLALVSFLVLSLVLRHPVNKINLLLFYLLQFVLSVVIQHIFFKLYIKNKLVKRFLVIGKKNEFNKLIKEIEQATFNKYKIIDFIDRDVYAKVINETFFDKFKDINENRLNAPEDINAILICDLDIEKEIKDSISKLKRMSIYIEYLPDVCERYLRRIPLEVLAKFEEYYEIIYEKLKEPSDKRVLDLLVSSIALVVLMPVILIVSFFILIEDKLPVVFTQKRVGLNNSIYTIHKFRSMKNKIKEDDKFAKDEKARILKVGKLIRPFRLDEVLQFYDIFRGRMSFIGPRPEQVTFVNEYDEKIPFYSYRHQFKPGLTGWAQISYHYSASLEETKNKLSYDLYYLKNRSLIFDLEIILKTIETVIFRKGAI